MWILRLAGICLSALLLFAGNVVAQQMKGTQPCSPKPMSMMGMGEVPKPDVLITTFEKQVVLLDEALTFAPTGMGVDVHSVSKVAVLILNNFNDL